MIPSFSWKSIVFLLVFIISGCCSYGEQSLHQKYISSQKECEAKDWWCQGECRLQFEESTGSCRAPAARERCFGELISYNYSWNAAVRDFPRQFSLLKKFPKCWVAIGPLLCSATYRPCAVRKYMTSNSDSETPIELWQVFSDDICRAARSECNFLVKLGLWPDLLRCEDRVEVNHRGPVKDKFSSLQRLFTNQSSCTANTAAPSFLPSQCIWPLIRDPHDLHLTGKALPVIDSCHLPCETPLAGFDWVLSSFRWRNALTAGCMGIVFLLITVYFFGFAKVFRTSLCMFCVGNGFLSISVYSIVWLASVSQDLRATKLCIDHGRIRRHPAMNMFEPCAIEALISMGSLISAYLWLFTLFMLRILRPRIRNDNYFTYGSRDNEMSARTVLCFLIYVAMPVMLVGTAVLFWNNLPVDAFSGVCHATTGSRTHTLLLFAGLGALTVVGLLTLLAVNVQAWWQTRRLQNSLINDVEVQRGDRNQSHPLITSENNCEEHAEVTYAKEHGLGETLIPGYWFGILGLTVITALLISAVLQFVIVRDVDQSAESEAVLSSIQCSLRSMQKGPDSRLWWNASNTEGEAAIHPYERKKLHSNSLTAPACPMPVIADGQLLAVYLSAVLLPCVPFWVLAVCFFAGFCGSGMLSVQKIRSRLNPFIREGGAQSDVRRHDNHLLTQSHREDDGRKRDAIDIELQSAMTAPTGISAPARMETMPAGTLSTDETRRIDSVTDDVSGVELGSVRSEPTSSNVREPRKLDLNLKRLQHKQDKQQFFEYQRSRRLFAIPQDRTHFPYNSGFYPGSGSSFNFPSVSQQQLAPSTASSSAATTAPNVPAELVQYIQELHSQNAMLLSNHAKATEDIHRLTQSVEHIGSALLNFAQTSSMPTHTDPPPLLLSQVRPAKQRQPPLSPSNESVVSTASSESSRVSELAVRMRSRRRLVHHSRFGPKMRYEKQEMCHKALHRGLMEAPQIPKVHGDTSEDDEVPVRAQFNWSLQNVPDEVEELRNHLESQYNPEEPDPLGVTEEHRRSNILFRIIYHCAQFFPDFLTLHFRQVVIDNFTELYYRHSHTFLECLGLDGDLEPLEVTEMPAAFDALWPLVAHAVLLASETLCLDSSFFISDTTEFIPQPDELNRFAATFMDPFIIMSEESEQEETLTTDPESDAVVARESASETDESLLGSEIQPASTSSSPSTEPLLSMRKRPAPLESSQDDDCLPSTSSPDSVSSAASLPKVARPSVDEDFVQPLEEQVPITPGRSAVIRPMTPGVSYKDLEEKAQERIDERPEEEAAALAELGQSDARNTKSSTE